MNFRTPIFLLTALFLPGLAAAGDVAAGEELYKTCVICHGADGEGITALDAPGLAGQSESYLIRQIWNFRNGKRGAQAGDIPGAQMRPMAMVLADGKEISDVAAYLSSLAPTTPPATIEGDAGNGQKQFTSKCGACHGGQGWGNEALFTPRLTGVGDSYLIRQVKNFQNGVRGSHEDAKYGKQMKMMSILVTDVELNDIVTFLNVQNAQE